MENNKLIAEFMGIAVIAGFNEVTKKCYYYYNNADMKDYEALPNYNSWEQLMEVIDKIQSIYETEEVFGVLIDICTTYVKLCVVEEGFRVVIDLKNLNGEKPLTKKEAVVQVIVEFIEWYNDTKPLNENQILGQSTII